jgi:hypothetical protein
MHAPSGLFPDARAAWRSLLSKIGRPVLAAAFRISFLEHAFAAEFAFGTARRRPGGVQGENTGWRGVGRIFGENMHNAVSSVLSGAQR